MASGWLVAKLSDCFSWVSSLLASNLAGLLGWLTACLLAPHRLRCPANLCGRRVAFCRCLTIRERGRERKGKGGRDERERERGAGREGREKAREIERTAWQETIGA